MRTLEDIRMLMPTMSDIGPAANGELDFQTIRLRFEQSGSLCHALGFDQAMIDSLYAWAFHLLRGGKPDRACGIFALLCALEATVADHWLGYGICLRFRGETRSALFAFEIASDLARRSSAPLLHTLELLVREGRWDEAREALCELDRRGKENPENEAIVSAAMPFRNALAMRGV